MKKLFIYIISIAMLAAAWAATGKLPADNGSEALAKYDTWTGVIRIWVCESLGGARRWVSKCADAAERPRDGVYINVRSVPDTAILEALDGGMEPPDMIIWPSGLPDSDSGLAKIDIEVELRKGLDAETCAVPLFTDGYVWAYRGALPGDMQGVAAACRESDLMAMTALSTGLRERELTGDGLPGIDIGLGGDDGDRVDAAPEDGISCRASGDLKICDSPVKAFISGEADAFTTSFSDITAMDTEAAVTCTGTHAWAGTVALASIPESEGADSGARRGICGDVLSYMLGDGQRLLSVCGAVPAAADARSYAGDIRLAAAEEHIMNAVCVHPPYFGRAADLSEIAREFIGGRLSADECMKLCALQAR